MEMTTTTHVRDGEPREHWFLLVDPARQPQDPADDPQLDAVLGGWPLEGEPHGSGSVGRFRPNPAYVPADENAPTDPLDAVLRLLQLGRADGRQVQSLLRDCLLDVVVNDDGTALITTAPDGVLCAVAATAQAHRARVRAPRWRQVDVEGLVELLPDDVDVLVNPGGPMGIRLTGDFLRDSLLLDDSTPNSSALADDSAPDDSALHVVRWER